MLEDIEWQRCCLFGCFVCFVLFCFVLFCFVLFCLVLLCFVLFCFVFPECVARVPVSFGGLGVRLCSRKVASMFATVRNRSQPFATVRNRSPATATICGSAVSSPQWRVRQEWSRKRVKLTRVAAVI